MPQVKSPQVVQGQTVVQPEQKGGGLWSLFQTLLGLGSLFQPWLAPAATASSVAQNATQQQGGSQQGPSAVVPSAVQPFNPYNPSLSPATLQQLRNILQGGAGQQDQNQGLFDLLQILTGGWRLS
jgi:hypothetical protein